MFTYELKGNGTAKITDYDWKGNTDTDVYVPKMVDGYTVTEIGENAFADAPEKKERITIVVPDGVTVIGDFAFAHSDGLSLVTLPASVQIIGKGAFSDSENLKVSVSSSNATFATIDDVLFNKKDKALIYYSPVFASAVLINTYVIPNGIKTIGAYAFYGVGKGNNRLFLTFPDSVTKIEEYAFYKCNVYGFPQNLSFIGDYAFFSSKTCDNVGGNTYTYLPETLTYIGAHAFEGADVHELGSLRIPDSVKYIGESAFKNCDKSWYDHVNYELSLHLPSSISEIPAYCFEGMNIGASTNYKGATSNRLKELEVHDPIQWPDNLRTIGAYAFSSVQFTIKKPDGLCPGIEFSADDEFVLSLPDTLQTIQSGAFEKTRCSLYGLDFRIIVPEGVTSIADNAFSESEAKIIELPASITTVTAEGDGAFCDRTKTTLKVVPGSYMAIWAAENGYPTMDDSSSDLSWLEGD